MMTYSSDKPLLWWCARTNQKVLEAGVTRLGSSLAPNTHNGLSVFVPGRISEKSCSWQLDTGAQRTLISDETSKQVGSDRIDRGVIHQASRSWRVGTQPVGKRTGKGHVGHLPVPQPVCPNSKEDPTWLHNQEGLNQFECHLSSTFLNAVRQRRTMLFGIASTGDIWRTVYREGCTSSVRSAAGSSLSGSAADSAWSTCGRASFSSRSTKKTGWRLPSTLPQTTSWNSAR